MIFNLLLCLYIVIIYFFTHLSKKEKKTKDNIFLFISLFTLIILVATREMTMGNDTQAYLNLFRKCNILKWNILENNTYYENGL